MSGLQATSYGLDLVTYVDKGSVINLIQCNETPQRLGYDSIIQNSLFIFFLRSRTILRGENLFSLHRLLYKVVNFFDSSNITVDHLELELFV